MSVWYFAPTDEIAIARPLSENGYLVYSVGDPLEWMFMPKRPGDLGWVYIGEFE